VVQLNQPQKESFVLQVQIQTALGPFRQAVEALQLAPEDATRFGGHVRIINEGAVRLEVVQASGLSQIRRSNFPRATPPRRFSRHRPTRCSPTDSPASLRAPASRRTCLPS